MNTALEIDEILLAQAKKILGTETIRETVEQSLRFIIRQNALALLANAAGAIPDGTDFTFTNPREPLILGPKAVIEG